MLPGTFGCPSNSDRNAVALSVAPIMRYLWASSLARSRSIQKLASEQGVYVVAAGSKGKGKHKQASGRGHRGAVGCFASPGFCR